MKVFNMIPPNIKYLFSVFDKDRNGYVSAKEIKKVH
jgi:Ca2+-binding EF-hand superfamily protein